MKPMLITETQLIAALKDILRGVETGDSFEGSIEYLMPYDAFDLDLGEWEKLPPEQQAMYKLDMDSEFRGTSERYTPKPDTFAVQASWRVGNSMGQGGMSMIGEME